jgi:adenylate kinase family enzyme
MKKEEKMQYKLIIGRPGSGKTTKALTIFISNSSGLYFTREDSKEVVLT